MALTGMRVWESSLDDTLAMGGVTLSGAMPWGAAGLGYRWTDGGLPYN